MAKNLVIPDWLERLIKQVLASDDWPNGQYPRLALQVRDRIGEFQDEDGQASLLQLVIDEIERLQAIVSKLADGVPVALQMKVYFRYGPGGMEHIRERTVASITIDDDGVWLEWEEKTAGPPGGRDATDCYSTREAAEAEEA